MALSWECNAAADYADTTCDVRVRGLRSMAAACSCTTGVVDFIRSAAIARYPARAKLYDVVQRSLGAIECCCQPTVPHAAASDVIMLTTLGGIL